MCWQSVSTLSDSRTFAKSRESKLTDEEWAAAVDEVARSEEAVRDEDIYGSAYALAHCQQYRRCVLNPWPLVVVRCNMAKDFRLLFKEGIRRGQGSEKQRAQAMVFILTWELLDDELSAAQLRLSSRHRYVCFENQAHDDTVRRPEIYVEEMRWTMSHQKQEEPGLSLLSAERLSSLLYL